MLKTPFLLKKTKVIINVPHAVEVYLQTGLDPKDCKAELWAG